MDHPEQGATWASVVAVVAASGPSGFSISRSLCIDPPPCSSAFNGSHLTGPQSPTAHEGMMLLFWPYARLGSTDTHDLRLYRADLLLELQDTLKALADIKAGQEIEREKAQSGDAQTVTAEAA